MGVYTDFGTYQTQVQCAVRLSVCLSVCLCQSDLSFVDLTVVYFACRKIDVLEMFTSPFQVFVICMKRMAWFRPQGSLNVSEWVQILWHWIIIWKVHKLGGPSRGSCTVGKCNKAFQNSSVKSKSLALPTTNIDITRLHSSRMHTARLLTVSPSMHYSGGGCLLRGFSGPRGGLIRGESLFLGEVSQHALRLIPPVNRILDTHYWKYYLAPNFVCRR